MFTCAVDASYGESISCVRMPFRALWAEIIDFEIIGTCVIIIGCFVTQSIDGPTLRGVAVLQVKLMLVTENPFLVSDCHLELSGPR